MFVLDVLLDLISELLTDIPKDVIGQDAHEGDTEDLEEEKELGTEGQEAGHPETAVVLGETERGISETPEGSDIPILTVSTTTTFLGLFFGGISILGGVYIFRYPNTELVFKNGRTVAVVRASPKLTEYR